MKRVLPAGPARPALDVPPAPLPMELVRGEVNLPELSELEVVRHYVRLSHMNFCINTHFYPLGSSTMKYNPKVNEVAAAKAGFTRSHPWQPEALAQGNLALMFRLQEMFKEITGFGGISLQPAAGAQAELAGALMIRAYHAERGDRRRTKILIPDSTHGTNPASAAMGGFQVAELTSDERGNIDLAALKAACDDSVAGLMVTIPNTLGLFDENIAEVVATVHQCGGLVYADGANLNALLGVVCPARLGFDMTQVNLNKSFATPHGTNGPGAGPLLAGELLTPYLPGPVVEKVVADSGQATYTLSMPAKSIGPLTANQGNFGVLVRAFCYIAMLGEAGLREVALNAVLNANYLKTKLACGYAVPYRRSCMHEFVIKGDIAPGIETMDGAKRLIDYGFHPPIVYFPLIVNEAMLIEPTETESKETLDAFAEAMLNIVAEARQETELLLGAPRTTPVSRLNQVAAARRPGLVYNNQKEET